MRSFRPKLTYANVMATIAVFVVLGGGAYAAATIGPSDIKPNAVRAKHIKNKNVTAPKIRNRAVFPDKLRKPPIWARVHANGTILGQSGGIKVISELNGVYQLDVGRNVGSGAVVAMPLDTDGVNDGPAAGGICSHTTTCSGAAAGRADAVRIYTTNLDGNASPNPFYFVVITGQLGLRRR